MFNLSSRKIKRRRKFQRRHTTLGFELFQNIILWLKQELLILVTGEIVCYCFMSYVFIVNLNYLSGQGKTF